MEVCFRRLKPKSETNSNVVDCYLFTLMYRILMTEKPGGGYSTDAWVGRCGAGVQTLTLFKTQFSDFHIPFETEFKIFRPYLRHLTQSHTLFRTRMK